MRLASWSEFTAREPALAAAVKDRFDANRHHVMATIRPDGSPRLSGTEVNFGDGELRLGMMDNARKLADLERDPRIELHSAPLEDDMAAGDVKVSGRLTAIEPWFDHGGRAFSFQIGRVSLVRVDGDQLAFEIWTPGGPSRTVRRS